MKKIKTIFIMLSITALLFLTFWLYHSIKNGGRTIEVKTSRFHISVHAVGTLKSAASSYIGCPHIPDYWEYTISFMYPEGKEVKKGERVLAFDDRILVERLTIKQSELETARKELEKIRIVEQETLDNIKLQCAQVQVDLKKARQKTGQPDEIIARNELKKLHMDLELAEMEEKLQRSRLENQQHIMKTRIREQESKIRRLENQVETLNTSIAKMTVTAPAPGIIVYATDWRGRKKAAGDQTWIGDNIIEMPDLSHMQVAAVIPEPEAGKINENMDVEIRLDSNPDRVFKGKIKELGRIFHTRSYDQPAMVFDALVDILDPDPEQMRPGMAAKVDIIVSTRENVLQVPEAALIYHEQAVYVRKKTFLGKSRIPVTIGTHSNGQVEILDGLEPGDHILIPIKENRGNQ